MPWPFSSTPGFFSSAAALIIDSRGSNLRPARGIPSTIRFIPGTPCVLCAVLLAGDQDEPGCYQGWDLAVNVNRVIRQGYITLPKGYRSQSCGTEELSALVDYFQRAQHCEIFVRNEGDI